MVVQIKSNLQYMLYMALHNQNESFSRYNTDTK